MLTLKDLTDFDRLFWVDAFKQNKEHPSFGSNFLYWISYYDFEEVHNIWYTGFHDYSIIMQNRYNNVFNTANSYILMLILFLNEDQS